mmetsp:Transcript_7143/g.17706  ORF Transcript_7143/g.17706 Transcript_7143/m.17706 type:complete len:95 (+) Transcript_7143:287-571(+)
MRTTCTRAPAPASPKHPTDHTTAHTRAGRSSRQPVWDNSGATTWRWWQQPGAGLSLLSSEHVRGVVWACAFGMAVVCQFALSNAGCLLAHTSCV